tara:strand:- start:408 stop:1523 length:1116 start_codon:yes stop_codon:yes gene_type:complete
MPASSRQGLSYPANLASIPYASYLKINKLTYDEGMAKVAKNQQDALGTVQNSAFAQTITKGVAGFFEELYTSKPDSNLNQDGTGSNRGEGRAAFKNSDGNVIPPPSKKKREQFMARQRGYNQSYCNLPLPNEMQYEYGANWNNTFKLGTLALVAEDPGKAAAVATGSIVIGGSLGGILKQFNNPNSTAAAVGQGVSQGLKTGANMFGVNSPINPTNLVGLAGLAPNENAIQMFKNVDFRSFDFSFEFAARNEDESRVIETIIEWFKRGMHPNTRGYSGATPLLGFPDVWTIEPRFVDTGYKNGGVKSVRHKMLPKTKLCALTNLRVNTTPMAQVQTVYDGTFPLITVSVRFTELTALTAADFVNDDFSLSY